MTACVHRDGGAPGKCPKEKAIRGVAPSSGGVLRAAACSAFLNTNIGLVIYSVHRAFGSLRKQASKQCHGALGSLTGKQAWHIGSLRKRASNTCVQGALGLLMKRVSKESKMEARRHAHNIGASPACVTAWMSLNHVRAVGHAGVLSSMRVYYVQEISCLCVYPHL